MSLILLTIAKCLLKIQLKKTAKCLFAPAVQEEENHGLANSNTSQSDVIRNSKTQGRIHTEDSTNCSTGQQVRYPAVVSVSTSVFDDTAIKCCEITSVISCLCVARVFKFH
jgi:hypothetical protein